MELRGIDVMKLILNFLLLLLSSALWAGEVAHVVFSSGRVQVDERTVTAGSLVKEGQTLSTGGDGYLYLKTIDNGFLILRPNSLARVVVYRLDPVTSSGHRFKIELDKGVARYISGEAVRSSRDNFRFNTPVAAIGVRGTDFTVFAGSDLTHVAVFSGGVVVSPFTDRCTVAGSGPCEGLSSRELFAGRADHVLSVLPGQVPVLLQGVENLPDSLSPPGKGEPSSREGVGFVKAGSQAVSVDLAPLRSNALGDLAVSATGVEVPASLTWGRWQAVLDQGADFDISSLLGGYELIGANRFFSVLRTREPAWRAPIQSNLSFSLLEGKAAIFNEVTRQVTTPEVENGLLQVNFGTTSFFTRFDLVSQGERFVMQSTGEVSRDGKLFGGYQFLRPNNMDVRGALSSNSQSAAYLFQGRLDEARIASGVTYWGK
jgi:hypothetical protein